MTTYNEHNYRTISQQDWLNIANTVVRYLTETEVTDVEYEPELRPQDAALLVAEDLGTVPANYYRFTWDEWQSWIKVNPTQRHNIKLA